MKNFYGDRHLDPDKVHPSLLQKLQKLQKIEQKDEKDNHFLIDINSHEKSNESNSLKYVYAEEYGVTSTCKDTCQEKDLKVSEIEKEDCVPVCHENYEDCQSKEKVFHEPEKQRV